RERPPPVWLPVCRRFRKCHDFTLLTVLRFLFSWPFSYAADCALCIGVSAAGLLVHLHSCFCCFCCCCARHLRHQHQQKESERGTRTPAIMIRHQFSDGEGVSSGCAFLESVPVPSVCHHHQRTALEHGRLTGETSDE
ncbi:unnamed protein product, partial [Hapterophycus canaliculatus]